MTAPDVSILLPIYNQADHIADVVSEYVDALSRVQASHELLLVVNGPERDGTLATCLELERRYETARVLRNERAAWGRAVKLGLAEAKGELLCYTNSARTSAKELTLLLLYAIVWPNAVIKANRKIREGAFRRFGSLLYNLECRALFDLPHWDINGTPKVFPRKFSRLLALTRDDELIDLEFNIICRLADYPIVEVPIYSTRRHGGKSTTNLRTAARLFWGAWRIRQEFPQEYR